MNSPQKLPRNLGFDLVRVTEAAAVKAGRWLGLGELSKADLEAARAMRNLLDTLSIEGRVIMGEERKFGEDFSISSGQNVGLGEGPSVDLILDPIDGRLQLAKGFPGVISAAAVAPRGCIWNPEKAIYMEKIVVNAEVAPYIVPECLDAPAAWTLALVARAKGVAVSNLSVFVLDRPRHKDLVDEIRASGAHVILRPDGDIAGALMVCTPRSGVDVLMGTGGMTEGLLAACAIKALGGEILGRLDPQSVDERNSIMRAGIDQSRILLSKDLVTSDQVFFSKTAITDGPLLEGVIYYQGRAETSSLLLRNETKTRRKIFAEHLLTE